jgi:hypothetical protein
MGGNSRFRNNYLLADLSQQRKPFIQRHTGSATVRIELHPIRVGRQAPFLSGQGTKVDLAFFLSNPQLHPPEAHGDLHM